MNNNSRKNKDSYWPFRVGVVPALTLALISIVSGLLVTYNKELPLAILGAFLLTGWILVVLVNIPIGLGILLSIRSSLDITTNIKLPLPGALTYLNLAGFVALAFSLAFIVHAMLKKRLSFPSTCSKLYGLFLVVTFLTVAISPDPLLSVQEWAKMLAPFCVYLVVTETYSLDSRLSGKNFSIVIVILMLASTIPLLLSGYQFVSNSGNHQLVGYNRLNGTFPLPNGLAMYLIIVIPVFLSAWELWPGRRQRIILFIYILFSIIILLYTFTRTGWFAFAASLLVLVLFSRKKVGIPIILGCLLLFGVMGFQGGLFNRFSDLAGSDYRSSSWYGRLLLWRAVTQPLFEQSPVLGHGLGSFPLAADSTGLQSVYGKDLPAAHNDYLRLLVETGVVGLSLYLMAIFSVLLEAWRLIHKHPTAIEKAFAIGFLAVCAGQFVAYASENVVAMPVIQFYFWALAGVISGLYVNWRSNLASVDRLNS